MTTAIATIVTIPRKMTGTGTIRDLASEHHDRAIEYPPGDHYAVVLPPYYRDNRISTHATLGAALLAGECRRDYWYQIVSDSGEIFGYDGTHLGNVGGES